MLLSYDEYLESAKKIIWKFNKCGSSSSVALLADDEIISTMVYWMAKSDETFDETKGKSQNNRRISYAIYGMLMAIREKKKAVNNCDYIKERSGYVSKIEDAVADTHLSLMDQLAYNEVMQYVNSMTIDDKSKEYFLYYYRDGLSLRQIADDTGYSHESIRQKINLVMNIVKDRYKNEQI